MLYSSINTPKIGKKTQVNQWKTGKDSSIYRRPCQNSLDQFNHNKEKV